MIWILILLAVAGGLHAVFAPNGALEWYRLREEVAKLRDENETLRRENERKKEEAERLVSDPQYQERAIRQDLGYVRPDELVFQFVPPVTDAPEPQRGSP